MEKRTFLKYGSFSPKIAKIFFLSKSVSGYFYLFLNKVPMANKPRGGGLKALVAGPLRKELFFAASLMGYFLEMFA